MERKKKKKAKKNYYSHLCWTKRHFSFIFQAAGAIIIEVRRQFAEIPGLREGTAQADSDRCVAISTQSSVEEMILPGLYAILSPITVGFLIGPRCLTGMLGGAIASGKCPGLIFVIIS